MLKQEADALVWAYGEDNVTMHHVYGMCRTPDNSLLAITEARVKPGDEEAHHLVVKKSRNGGETWSESYRLEESRNGECWANMSPVVDYRRGRIWLFYALNHDNNWTEVFCRFSEDDGDSWSDRMDMTGLVKGRDCHDWTFFFPGPGHGIQLERQPVEAHNGRLVVSFWNRLGIDDSPRRYGTSTILLDETDDGAEFGGWQHGGHTPIALPDGRLHGMNEPSVVELPNGKLLFHARGANSTWTFKKRVYAYSKDGGRTIGDLQVVEHFGYRGCQGATIAHDGVLFFSHPDDPEARRNLTISVSTDDGASWRHQRINEIHCNYSDMAVLPGDKLCVLHGSGDQPIGNRPREVRLKRFAIRELERG